MTVTVFAVDAADLALVERWGLDNLTLDRHQPLETAAWGRDYPLTLEVWPTVATGATPDVHGVFVESMEMHWESSPMKVASTLAAPIPKPIRSKLGKRFVTDSNTSRTFPKTSLDHPFDALYEWPGITDITHLEQFVAMLPAVEVGNLSQTEAFHKAFSLVGDEIAWAIINQGQGLTGVHSHVLDLGGHVNCRSEAALRYYYETMDSAVGYLRDRVDDLVILSDHGMQTSFLGDDDPGVHSWRSYIAATDGVPEPLPASIHDVSDWLAGLEAEPSSDAPLGSADVDTRHETLVDLGYVGGGGGRGR